MLVYILVLVSLYIMTKAVIHKMRNYPPRFPLIGILYLFRKPIHRSLATISFRYGPILLLKLGIRRVLFVASSSLAEECLTKNDIVFANRPRLYAGKYGGGNYTSLAWAPYGPNWRNLRKISASELLSPNRLQMLCGERADEVKVMCGKLYRQRGRAVDMNVIFYDLTLNTMMRTIGGKRNLEEIREYREVVAETLRVGGVGNIGDYFPPANWTGTLDKKLSALHQRREKCLQVWIEANRSNSGTGEGRKTMVESLLSLQQTDPHTYSDEVIRNLILDLMVAGTDTSASTMEWGMSLLLNHPHVLKKAQNEIDRCVGHDRLIEESDLQNLPYLRCVINETMRMYPAGQLLLPHENSEECTVGGYRIPSKTTLVVNLWAIQNDPKTWEEPAMFKPERFQGLEGVRDGYKFMPFGSGRRSCPGEGLGVRMAGMALGSLLQCFDWERVGKEMVDMREGQGLTLPKAHPWEAICQPRPPMDHLLSQL